MKRNVLSKTVLERLPTYLHYLKSLPANAPENISATTIANELGLGEVQVRKDLASVSNLGKPRIGYIVSYLIDELDAVLGYNNSNDTVIVGAGKLGKALLAYEGFKNYGFNMVSAFDIDEEITGQTEMGKNVFPLSEFKKMCKDMRIKIGVITVPAEQAQAVCDLMIESGILAIWNFAPTHLNVPNNILVQNENMATSLALLSSHLTEQMNEENH
ncbi:MAG TPA: redox-sensing transcriptional repressor Rex [Clostridiales bacterium]|nr:redox-sensing transcriptional repressor Rex [Clostridiales bacterium]